MYNKHVIKIRGNYSMNSTFDTIIACVGFILSFYGMFATILLFTTLTKVIMLVGLALMGVALAHDSYLEKERRKKVKLSSCAYDR